MVALGHRVEVAYTGRLEDGTVFDSTAMHGGRPYSFLIGRGQAIPGFDKAVSEMEEGEKRRIAIPSEMAYGAYRPDLVEDVPCDAFPHWENLPVGGYIVLNVGGSPLRCKVLKIEDGRVYLDKNHELAGKSLTFDIELLRVHGEGKTAIEQEEESGCACGCDALKDAIDPLRRDRAHAHGEGCCHG